MENPETTHLRFTSLWCPLRSYSSKEKGQDFAIWKQKRFMVFIRLGFVLDLTPQNRKPHICMKGKGRREAILREQGDRCHWALERHPSPWPSCDRASEIFSSPGSRLPLQFSVQQQGADIYVPLQRWVCSGCETQMDLSQSKIKLSIANSVRADQRYFCSMETEFG